MRRWGVAKAKFGKRCCRDFPIRITGEVFGRIPGGIVEKIPEGIELIPEGNNLKYMVVFSVKESRIIKNFWEESLKDYLEEFLEWKCS